MFAAPSRAPTAPGARQVSDIAIAVREGADAVMLSGETAFGKFPFKAVEVMGTVSKRTESSMLSYSVRALRPAAQPISVTQAALRQCPAATTTTAVCT